MNASAVILAAGRGERMRSTARKAFLELAGRPLFLHAVETFSVVSRVAEIVVVVHRSDVEIAREALSPTAPTARVVAGGATRRESSLAGIRSAAEATVLIHDGCRPFVSRELIDRILDAAETHGAVVPILPSIETLYRLSSNKERVGEILDRSSIVRAQTPQAFRRDLVIRSLEEASSTVTDDASAFLEQGEPVFTVEGETINLKITVPEDLRWAEAYAGTVERRSGR